jgi:signal transduction histidine kinase
MTMDTPNRRNEMFRTFWNFLAYLEKYIAVANVLVQVDTDPARTLLLSTLIEYMCPALRADLTFVGYRNLEDNTSDWLQVVKESMKGRGNDQQQSALVKRMEELDWRLPYNELVIVRTDYPIVLFDQGLQKLPSVLQGVVTALAASRVALSGRDYFLFFCDVEEKVADSPRYTDFDKAMLKVATGILEIGFRSGVRKGRRVQQDIEEEQTRRFLLELIHELKTPIQAILADATNIQTEMPAEWTEFREMATRNLSAARHLSLLVDNIRATLSEQKLSDEPLVVISVENPLRAALEVLVGEARAKGLRVRGPHTLDGQPFPEIPLYSYQLAIAFKNLIHNAIVYSLSKNGEYIPVEILGYSLGKEYYAVDITNYGIEITQEEIAQGKLFRLRYRGEKARQLVTSGSGLGLASVQRIVEKHAGKIRVTSVAAESNLFRNTFSLTLPKTGPQKEKSPQ